jgi:hypothetical protein
MKYRVKTVSLSHLLITNRGVAEPLCARCKTKDCDNHVEARVVSIYGVNHQWRMLIKGGQPFFVTECVGYT